MCVCVLCVRVCGVCVCVVVCVCVCVVVCVYACVCVCGVCGLCVSVCVCVCVGVCFFYFYLQPAPLQLHDGRDHCIQYLHLFYSSLSFVAVRIFAIILF